MSETTQSRLLTKTIPGIQLVPDGATTVDIQGTNLGWEQGTVTIDGASYPVFVYTASFDLSGYSLQDKTLFAQGVLIQKNPSVYGDATAFVSNIVSTEPLNLEDFEVSTPYRSWALPGNLASSYSMQQILYGDSAYWANDTTTNVTRQLNFTQWGTGASTARDKLYVAVALVVPPNQLGPVQLIYPDTTFVIPSVIAEEPELEYMMRLARSVESV